MKNIIIILLFLVAFNGSSQEDEKSQKIKNLGYKVEKHYEYLTKFGEIDTSTKFLEKRIEFNNEGRVKKTEQYFRGDDSNEYGYVATFKYDEKSNIIKLVNYNAKGNIKNVIKYEYRDSLMRVIRIYSKDGDLTTKVEYEYNKQNEPIKYISYDSSGKLEGKNTYEYDSNNKLKKTSTFNKEKKLASYTLYKNTDSTKVYKDYNNKNELELEVSKKLDSNGMVLISLRNWLKYDSHSKTIYEYDINGLEIKRTEFGKNGEPEKFIIIERN